ncbi:MAG: hypothetical protein K6E36_06385 [Oscillospiraceae bacterium]|nr:hypothetical protein [Oscillospiraceae bacterium]
MRMSVAFFTILTQNLVFTRLLGLSGFSFLTQRGKSLLPSSLLVLCICPLNTVLLFLLQSLIADPVWTAVIAVCLTLLLTAAVDLLLRVLLKESASAVEPHLLTAACSGAILGILWLSDGSVSGVSSAFSYGIKEGTGFFIAAAMLEALKPAVCSEQTPAVFRGWRGIYLSAGLLSMAAACITASVLS